MASEVRSQATTTSQAALAWSLLGAALVAAGLGLVPTMDVKAKPRMYLAPFYANTRRLNPQGQPLGKVLASEPTVSTVPGSKAWRIAYVSSDGEDRRTVVTALIV